MTITLHKCPVHGVSESVAMDGGIYCVAEDPAQPYGICNRETKGAEIDPETGKPYELNGEPFPGQVSSKAKLRTAAARGRETIAGRPVRDAKRKVSRVCEQCLGAFSTNQPSAKRCDDCRAALSTTTWSARVRRMGIEAARKVGTEEPPPMTEEEAAAEDLATDDAGDELVGEALSGAAAAEEASVPAAAPAGMIPGIIPPNETGNIPPPESAAPAEPVEATEPAPDPEPEPPATKTCAQCDADFLPKLPQEVRCSPCRRSLSASAWNRLVARHGLEEARRRRRESIADCEQCLTAFTAAKKWAKRCDGCRALLSTQAWNSRVKRLGIERARELPPEPEPRNSRPAAPAPDGDLIERLDRVAFQLVETEQAIRDLSRTVAAVDRRLRELEEIVMELADLERMRREEAAA